MLLSLSLFSLPLWWMKILTVRCAACPPQWSVLTDQNSLDGVLQADYGTEQLCRDFCAGLAACVAVDFNFNDRECWSHTDANNLLEVFDQPGTNQYRIDRSCVITTPSTSNEQLVGGRRRSEERGIAVRVNFSLSENSLLVGSLSSKNYVSENVLFSRNLGTKLKFSAPVSAFVGNLHCCPSENCIFRFYLLFLTHDATASELLGFWANNVSVHLTRFINCLLTYLFVRFLQLGCFYDCPCFYGTCQCCRWLRLILKICQ